MKPTLLLATLGLVAATLTPLSAATITFGTETDYTNNFTETANGTELSWNNGGYLDEYHATTTTSSVARYNTAVSGDFNLSLDASFTSNLGSYAGASVGFLTQVNGTDATSTGYLSVFRLTTTGADFRVFEGATLNGTSVGTTLVTRTISGSFSANTYYTFSLDVEHTETGLTFIGSILNATTGSVIGTFTSYTNTTPTNADGSTVGIRLGTINGTHTYADNFDVTLSAIPEPSTYGLLGGASILGLVLCTRRKRA